MKNKFILTVLVSLTASGLAAAGTNDLTTPLQRGLFEEEANHQLDAAIVNYKEAIEHFDQERQLAATAIFRLGECYRKLGRTNEANAQYERIVREFPDQTQLAQLSQTYYIPGKSGALVMSQGGPANPLPAILPPDEAKFLQQVKESVQDSPDLMNQQLETAAMLGYVSAAEYLIAHGADVNRSSCIVVAAKNGNEAMVQLLLSHGAAVDGRNNDVDGRTALFDAVGNGFMTVCRTLVAHGADVNAKAKDGSTPLQVAVEVGQLSAAEFLVTNKAEINVRTENGMTPLSSAVMAGEADMVKLLLDHRADANLETEPPNGPRSPLSFAVEYRHPQIAQLLLDHGAKPNVTDRNGNSALLLAIGQADINRNQENVDMIRLLVEHGADINVKDNSGSTPLYNAVERGALQAADILITNKAQVDLKTLQGATPLMLAVIRDNTNIAKLILDNHADANLESTYLGRVGPGTGGGGGGFPGGPPGGRYLGPRSPLLEAIVRSRKEMVQLLLDHGAKPNAPDSNDSNGITPLRLAVQFDNVDVVGLLIDHGADINILDKQGVSPLLWAIENSRARPAQLPMIQFLLDHGAKANEPDSNDSYGITPLFHAIQDDNIDAVRMLIAHGADVNFLDKRGDPPLSFVTQTSFSGQIRDMLIKAGADANYTRRRGIWTYGDDGSPKDEIFQCPTNSINHYTLLEFLATLYQVQITQQILGQMPMGHYVRPHELVLFPDFARVSIHRLAGKRAEVLRVNVAEIFETGDCSKDVALQPGDVIEIAKEEHKVADKWYGVPAADVRAVNKCLLRKVRITAQTHTNDIELVPSFAAGVQYLHMQFPDGSFDTSTDWLTKSLIDGKADIVVRSFLLNSVVRDANVLLNTWDLSRVQLMRGGAKMTFDLTTNPAPDVWLEDGDVIEIPELGDVGAAADAK